MDPVRKRHLRLAGALAAAVLLALGVAVLGIVVGRRRRLRTSR